MNFKLFLKTRQKRINRILESYFPSPNKEPKQLCAAVRYAVLNGGKRLRPLLVYAVGETFNASLKVLDAPACAVELIHSFSLIHDDLPAMDDDDFRRGIPSCHKVFGEAIAILAGDTLPWLALKILCEHKSLKPEIIHNMVHILSKACGLSGLAGGQALDINAIKQKGTKISIRQLENIYRMKTGSLFRACIQLGAIAANIKDQYRLSILDEYAKDIGFAFQLQDDILDIKNENDKEDEKITYPRIVGIEKTKLKAQYLYKKAMFSLKRLNADTTLLVSLTNYIMQRGY